MTKPNEINASPLIPDAIREALPKDWLSLVDQAARGWGCTGSEIQRLGAGAKVVTAHLASATTRVEADRMEAEADHLEAATTLQAAQTEIARLAAVLEERRVDVARLAGRLSDSEVLTETALARAAAAQREYAEERADLNAAVDHRGHEIARLTAALEERRDDVGRLTGRLSDAEVQLAEAVLACDVAKREYAEERADKKRLVSAAGLEIEHLNTVVDHLNAVADHRGLRITRLLGTVASVKRREDDLTAEVEYQRARVDELGRRLTAANDQAEHDAAAVLAAAQARSAAERALKELQDQVVGAMTDLPTDDAKPTDTPHFTPEQAALLADYLRLDAGEFQRRVVRGDEDGRLSALLDMFYAYFAHSRAVGHDRVPIVMWETAKIIGARQTALQAQGVGTISSVAPSYTVPDEIELGPAGPSRARHAVVESGLDELQRLRAEIYNLRSELSHRTGQVEGMQVGAEFMKREVARLEANVARLQEEIDARDQRLPGVLT